MLTNMLRLHGKNDLRLDSVELPPITSDEVLVQIVTNSVCMSDHKAADQGVEHKRVPRDIAQNPIVIGHELAGVVLEVGANYKSQFQPGDKFSVQPAIVNPRVVAQISDPEMAAPGYTFKFFGGQAMHGIVPKEVLEQGCLLPFKGDAFFTASLAEALSCVIGAYHASFHVKQGTYVHVMDIVPNGSVALLASAGPMGFAAIDYALHRDRKPGVLVVTDIDDAKLSRAAQIYTPGHAASLGVQLLYVNTRQYGTVKETVEALRALTPGNRGFNEAFVFFPHPAVIAQADGILAKDGCLNFFAGPEKSDFTAPLNWYNVHYAGTHPVGTSGGNTDDLKEALDLMGQDRLNPAAMITHIGGITAAAEATINLPNIPGGKKLIYTHLNIPLMPINDLARIGSACSLNHTFATILGELSEIVRANNGLWSRSAEQYLLSQPSLRYERARN